ncbi:MAG: sigma-70 family RNA polymerase sigma factor [Chthonomonadales bacterium]
MGAAPGRDGSHLRPHLTASSPRRAARGAADGVERANVARKGPPAAMDNTTPGTPEPASYIGRLTREPLLTAAEELELAHRVREGDTEAKRRLVEANMRLVVSIARNYHCPLLPFDDLVQEGAIGLMTACERFDPTRGFRFSTYASHWIRQAISRAIDNKSRSIRVPAHVSEAVRRIERTRARMMREGIEEPTIHQIAERLEMDPVRVEGLLRAAQDVVSLDTLVGEGERTPLWALINDEKSADPEECALQRELTEELERLLATLSERERIVMRRRFGMDGASREGHALQDIGKELKLSRERVRQIEAQALKHLRAVARRRHLREYLNG